MATELYGVDARLVASIGTTPVSTETNIIFIGASASGDLNNPVIITSMSDYGSKLGGAPGDGYNLTEAALAAFNVANIDKCWMIPVSHNLSFVQSEYMGSASDETGIYAIEGLLRNSPTAVNIICAPGINNATVLNAINSICQKAAGHWQSFCVYDLMHENNQINSNNIAQPTNILTRKNLQSERARAVWGNVKVGEYSVSGAAVQACLMSVSDANYGVPARCGGNLAVNNINGICLNKSIEVANSVEASTGSDDYSVAITLTGEGYTDYDGLLRVIMSVSGHSDPSIVSIDSFVEFENGVATIDVAPVSEFTNPAITLHIVLDYSIENITIRESDATSLSADGVCTWINYGGGNWHTWGDHTSEFSGGSISDERGRFDNYIRMQMMLANRFQLKYRFTIDDPMTLQMRNDVITEEEDYLNSLVAIGALIGQPKVEFIAADNTIDNIAQGYFTWSISTTEAPPLKYMLAKVAYTQAGLDVFTQEG